MTVTALAIDNYRSIRELHLPLGRITVLVGENGCGKTNCYRAVRLLHAAACGRLAEAFAEEGGMPSALWAGGRSARETLRLRVGVDIDRFSYALACGLPTPKTYGYPPIGSLFLLDPEVKEEDVTVRLDDRRKPVPMCQRRNHVVTLRDGQGERVLLTDSLDLSESVLSQIADPSRYAEMALMHQLLLGWRFYHQFRTDTDSPLRDERIGVRSPVLASDGLNLAAALQTIIEIGHEDELQTAIERAFPKSHVSIVSDDAGRLGIRLYQPGIQRPFTGRELSDGTLRFLCLAAALLTPRTPSLLVLNEPETSLHPDLLPALATMIRHAGSRGQVLLTTHALSLAEELAADGAVVHRLEKHGGQTALAGDRGLRGERVDRGLLNP